MKLQSSSKFEASTLPTIYDHSFALNDEQSSSRSSPTFQFNKMRQLELVLQKCINEKNSLLSQQRLLERNLQEKLNVVQIILKDKQNQIYQQGCCQNSKKLKNMKHNVNNKQDQKRLQDSRQYELESENIHKKFYSALITPKLQFSDNSNTLQNSRTQSTQTDEEINKASACNIKESKQPKIPNKWYKTPIITQKLRQPNFLQNKYKSIEQIWGQATKKHPNQKQKSLLHTYL